MAVATAAATTKHTHSGERETEVEVVVETQRYRNTYVFAQGKHSSDSWGFALQMAREQWYGACSWHCESSKLSCQVPFFSVRTLNVLF